MTTHLRNLGAYAKSLAAAVAGLGGVLVSLTPVAEAIPGGASVLMTASAAVTALAVYLSPRNVELVDRMGDNAADLLDR